MQVQIGSYPTSAAHRTDEIALRCVDLQCRGKHAALTAIGNMVHDARACPRQLHFVAMSRVKHATSRPPMVRRDSESSYPELFPSPFDLYWRVAHRLSTIRPSIGHNRRPSSLAAANASC